MLKPSEPRASGRYHPGGAWLKIGRMVLAVAALLVPAVIEAGRVCAQTAQSATDVPQRLGRQSAAAGTTASAVEPLAKQGCPLSPPELPTPFVDVRAFGAVGDGRQDDTIAINAAVASLEKGGTVQFGPGVYRHDGIIWVDRPGVALVGRGATLVAGTATLSAIYLSGDRSIIMDLTVSTLDPGARGDRDEHSGIVVTGAGNIVFRAKVSRSKSAGIMVVGGREFLIACSDAFETKADAIHMTRGSRNGRVVFNSVWNSEDDGIAVVSYHGDRQSSGIIIEDNSVEHIRWGRGISIIGSADAVIRRNTVRAIAMAAGIIVAREGYWRTQGARDVVIENNRIFDIQESLAPLNGGARTGQAAIDLNSDGDDAALAVSDVRIVGNVVLGSRFGGVRLEGNVSRVSIIANSLEGVTGAAIARVRGRPVQDIECRNNAGPRQMEPCRTESRE